LSALADPLQKIPNKSWVDILSTFRITFSYHKVVSLNRHEFYFPYNPVEDWQLVQKDRGDKKSRIVETDIIVTISSSDICANSQSSTSAVSQHRESQMISAIIIGIGIRLKPSRLCSHNDLLDTLKNKLS
jgi:hypothetical protein